MIVSVIKSPATGEIFIKTDFKVQSWYFIGSIVLNKQALHNRIIRCDEYSCTITPNDWYLTEDIEKYIVSWFNKNYHGRYYIEDYQYISTTLQELTLKLRRLEKEVNPSFIQHTKTLLGLL